MDTQYITYYHPVGLCNHFYYILQSYIKSTPQKKVIQCIKPQEVENGIYDLLCKLNLAQFVSTEQKGKFIHEVMQTMGKDFTYEQLESFIKQYLLKSKPFIEYEYKHEESKVEEKKENIFIKFIKKYFTKSQLIIKEKDQERCLAFHIRNGDYLNRAFSYLNCFNRVNYINLAVNHPAIAEFKEIHIYSDDIELCKKLYDEILTKRFQVVRYIHNENYLDDFLDLSHYKNKILWNSTFSYWSTFISDILYEHKGLIICPERFTSSVTAFTHIPPYWITVPVK